MKFLVAFGKPIHGFIDATAMKQKVLELSFSVWEKVMSKRKPLMHHWLNSAKSNLFKEAAVDAQGTKLNNLEIYCCSANVCENLESCFRE